MIFLILLELLNNMKFHLEGALKLGKFEFKFKTLEFKVKVEHEVVLLHVEPRKVGFVVAHNHKVLHLAVSFLFAHVCFTYHKTCECHPT